MNNDSQPISFFSLKAAHALWILSVALAVFVFALTLWGWASRGYAWTTFLDPVGLLLLVATYPIVRSRPTLYLVFQVIAMSLLIASLILRAW